MPNLCWLISESEYLKRIKEVKCLKNTSLIKIEDFYVSVIKIENKCFYLVSKED